MPVSNIYQHQQQQQPVVWPVGYPMPCNSPSFLPHGQVAYFYTPMPVLGIRTNSIPTVSAIQLQPQPQPQTPYHHTMSAIDCIPNSNQNKASIQFLLNPMDESEASLAPLPNFHAVCSQPTLLGRNPDFPHRVQTAKHQDIVIISSVKSSTGNICSTTKNMINSHTLGVNASAVTKESSQSKLHPGNPKVKPKKRQTWTPEQDAMLIHAVNKCGAKNWPHIASFIPGRSADNVRLRYMYTLQYANKNDITIAERPFTEEEDAMIVKEGEGNRQWKNVGQQLGRSCSAVRNRYEGLRRMAMRKERKMARIKECQVQMDAILKVFEERDH